MTGMGSISAGRIAEACAALGRGDKRAPAPGSHAWAIARIAAQTRAALAGELDHGPDLRGTDAPAEPPACMRVGIDPTLPRPTASIAPAPLANVGCRGGMEPEPNRRRPTWREVAA